MGNIRMAFRWGIFVLISLIPLAGCNPVHDQSHDAASGGGATDGKSQESVQGEEKVGYYLFDGEPHEIHYIEKDGKAIYDRCMVLYKDWLFDTKESALKKSLAKTTGMQIGPTKANRFIAYTLDNPVGAAGPMDATMTNQILQALNTIMRNTNIIFYPAIEPDRINFNRIAGRFAFSNLGWVPGRVKEIQLNPQGAGQTNDQYVAAVIIHEIMHALGFAHEQTRRDREQFLDVYMAGNQRGLPNYHCSNPNASAIDSRAVPNGNGSCLATNQWNTTNLAHYGAFDINSVMLYHSAIGALQDANGNTLRNPATNVNYSVLLPRGTPLVWNHPVIPVRSAMSAGDITNLNALYPVVNGAVGWIDRGGTCNGTRGWIRMDDEDNGNITQAYVKTGVSGSFSTAWNGTTGLHRFNQETRLNFCRENLNQLLKARNDYAVLLMGGECPRNGYRFTRNIRNEENGNGNANSGAIAPNSQTRTLQFSAFTGYYYTYTTHLEFCFVPGEGTASLSPPWQSRRQGAFTMWNSDFGTACREYHWHIQDGENGRNPYDTNDPFTFSPEARQFETRIRNLFNSTGPGQAWADPQYFWNACP